VREPRCHDGRPRGIARLRPPRRSGGRAMARRAHARFPARRGSGWMNVEVVARGVGGHGVVWVRVEPSELRQTVVVIHTASSEAATRRCRRRLRSKRPVGVALLLALFSLVCSSDRRGDCCGGESGVSAVLCSLTRPKARVTPAFFSFRQNHKHLRSAASCSVRSLGPRMRWSWRHCNKSRLRSAESESYI